MNKGRLELLKHIKNGTFLKILWSFLSRFVTNIKLCRSLICKGNLACKSIGKVL